MITHDLSARGRRPPVRRLPVILLFTVMAFTGTIVVAGEKGWFGFAMAIDLEGAPLDPKLRTIKVESIVPSSPAAFAGLTPGDLVLEIEGITVAGANAATVKAAMQRSVGESLHLKIKHGADAPRDVVLTAAPKPSQ